MAHRLAVILTAAALAAATLSCTDDETATAPATISIAQLAGTWALTRIVSTWDYVDNGTPTSGTVDSYQSEVTEILIFDTATYAYYTTDYSCYELDTDSYQLSGTTILADEWTGSWSSGAQSETWITTASRSGTTLILTYRETWNLSSDERGWYQEVYYYSPHDGNVPPANWPSSLCKTTSRPRKSRR